MVINVGAFVKDAEIRLALYRDAEVRYEALRRCYLIPGYKDLTREEKNRTYDAIKKEVESEFT